jgi:thiol-disulfide isomerase/thioredoxin
MDENMNKKILLAIIGLSLLSCNFLFPPKATPSPVIKSARTEETAFPETHTPPRALEETTIPKTKVVSASDSFTIVRLHPGDGDLTALLASEAKKAAALGQMPVVEFDATWCPPCKAIDQGLKEKNKLMVDAYAGTYIIKLDVDEWGWGDSTLHDFDFDGIPVYFKLDAEGKPTGETVDGNAWGDNIPENMAPVMDKFFHGE